MPRLGSGGRPQNKNKYIYLLVMQVKGTYSGGQSCGRGHVVVGVAAGMWAWLQGSGHGCRAVGVAAGPWAGLQGRGRGCRAVGVAVGL